VREAGLGRYRDVTLAQARARAAELRVMARRGTDPIEERRATNRAAKPGLTFREAAEATINTRSAEWRNTKTVLQWHGNFREHVYPSLGDVQCRAVTRSQVLAVLQPIWLTKTVTARRLRSRIARVLSYAAAIEGWDASAANWSGGLDQLLPRPSRIHMPRHHAAARWQDTPDLLERLRARDGVAARALEFVVLTAARSRPVRLMRWNELDLERGIWTCPRTHMKGGKSFRVPLSGPAIALLRGLEPLRTGSDSLVFPGLKFGRPLSENSLLAVLQRMGLRITVHGFRSTFRDWAADQLAHPDVAEVSLDHALPGGGTRTAYQRTDLLDSRRDLIGQWSNLVSPLSVATE
jgi:integrase